MSKHERFTTAVNDSTGDLIKTKASNQQAYAESWERIFGKKEDMLKQLVDDGKLNPNVQRRHEEMNIGKGEGLSAQTTPLLGLGTKLGIEYGDGLEYQNMVREGILSQSEFEEELLPEGIIEDEV